MPSRAGAPFLQATEKQSYELGCGIVSMPSRASAPFLLYEPSNKKKQTLQSQCPLGLKLHFYGTHSKT